MAEQLSLDQKREALFMQLVLSFQAAAWQQMGKIKNPLTDKIERDLQQAQMSIDMIDMLKAKTKGNLNENESRFIDHVLRELQLNYVDEVEKDKKAAQEKLKEEKKEKPQEQEKPEATESEKKQDS